VLCPGLANLSSFEQTGAYAEVSARLDQAYANVDAADAWTGVLVGAPAPGRLLGETMHRLAFKQFERLRGADRFWHRQTLDPGLLVEVGSTPLRDIIPRNTDIGDVELSQDIRHSAQR
jgi:hypothetical protein